MNVFISYHSLYRVLSESAPLVFAYLLIVYLHKQVHLIMFVLHVL